MPWPKRYTHTLSNSLALETLGEMGLLKPEGDGPRKFPMQVNFTLHQEKLQGVKERKFGNLFFVNYFKSYFCHFCLSEEIAEKLQ